SGLAPGPSKIGGLAAAEDMAKLLGDGKAIPMTEPKDTVQLSRELQAQVAATPEATDQQAASGLTRAPRPLGVSGLDAKRMPQLSKRLTGGDRSLKPYRA